jgi:prepilin-type N-terminal cleavage/methylation domain-containing protein
MTNTQRPSYTLIELLVVIAIMGILSAIGVMTINIRRAQAQNNDRAAGARTIQVAMERYYQKNGQYPFPTLPSNCGESCKCNDAICPGCQVNQATFDYTWGGLQTLLAQYLDKSLPNDPFDVSISSLHEDYEWHVIVSGITDRHQHYVIVVRLDGPGSEQILNSSSAIKGIIIRQQYSSDPAIASQPASVSFHSRATAPDGCSGSFCGFEPSICHQTSYRDPLNGMFLYCGKKTWVHNDAVDPYTFPSGTYNNFCVGNIFKLPTSTQLDLNVGTCDTRGWLEERPEVSGCYPSP